jgi:hypothetical protein
MTTTDKNILKGLTHSIVLPFILSFISIYLGVFWIMISLLMYFFVKKNTKSAKYYFIILKYTGLFIASILGIYIYILLACALS